MNIIECRKNFLFLEYRLFLISKKTLIAISILIAFLILFKNTRCETASFLYHQNMLRSPINKIEKKGKEKAISSDLCADRFQYLEILFYEGLHTGNCDWFTSCFLRLQIDFPDSDYAFQASLLVILTELEKRDFEKALQWGEIFLKKYKNHPKKRKLEALTCYARARSFSKASNRLKAIEECKNYFNKFSDQYHKKALEPIISWNEARLEYGYRRREYFKHNFRKAADIMFDYSEQYARFSDLTPRAINTAFHALYHGKYYEEFLERYDNLEPWWFEQSWADDILFLKAAILVRKSQGREARRLLDFLENNFEQSSKIKQILQLRAESYIRGNNALEETLAGGPEEVSKAFHCITLSLENALLENSIKKIVSHFGMLNTIANHGKIEWEALKFLEKINKSYTLNNTTDFYRRLTRAKLLVKVGEINLAEDELKSIILTPHSYSAKLEIKDLLDKIK